jgi:hypothetical protein
MEESSLGSIVVGVAVLGAIDSIAQDSADQETYQQIIVIIVIILTVVVANVIVMMATMVLVPVMIVFLVAVAVTVPVTMIAIIITAAVGRGHAGHDQGKRHNSSQQGIGSRLHSSILLLWLPDLS